MSGDILDFAMHDDVTRTGTCILDAMDSESYDFLTRIDILEHHGVKGMEWGDRKYQYEDGALTPLGRIHYGIGKPREPGKEEQHKKSRKRRDDDDSDSSKETAPSKTPSSDDKPDDAEKKPKTEKKARKVTKEDLDKAKKAATVALGAAAVGLTAYAAYKAIKTNQNRNTVYNITSDMLNKDATVKSRGLSKLKTMADWATSDMSISPQQQMALSNRANQRAKFKAGMEKHKIYDWFDQEGNPVEEWRDRMVKNPLAPALNAIDRQKTRMENVKRFAEQGRERAVSFKDVDNDQIMNSIVFGGDTYTQGHVEWNKMMTEQTLDQLRADLDLPSQNKGDNYYMYEVWNSK